MTKTSVQSELKELIAEQLESIGDHGCSDYFKEVCYYDKAQNTITLCLSNMYEPPNINLQFLMALAEHFGTQDIKNYYDIQQSGCETCDYGSEYGHTIYIKDPTKNIPEV